MLTLSPPRHHDVPVVDTSWVDAFMPASDDDEPASSMLNPHDMLVELSAYEAIAGIAHSEPVGCPIDWEAWLAEGDDVFGCGYRGNLAEIRNLHEDFLEPIVEHFVDGKIDLNDESADDTLLELEAFIQSPSTEAAKNHPLLRDSPTAVAMMHAIEAERQRVVARSILPRLHRPVVLHAEIEFPKTTLPLQDMHTELWVWMVPDDNNIDPTRPNVFLISASLIAKHVGQSSQAPELIAAIKGMFIPTVIRDFWVPHRDLFEIMDAHSQQLNDVWKTVHGEYLPEHEVDDFMEFGFMQAAFEDLEDEDLGSGLCIPWVAVGEAYRGCELGVLLLEALQRVCRSASTYEHRAGLSPSTTAMDETESADTITNLTDVLEVNPIRLFVLGIEGTRPVGRQVANPLARGSLAKEAPIKVVEHSAEKRRLGLTRYFRRAQDRTLHTAGFGIHAYNPWDYPFT